MNELIDIRELCVSYDGTPALCSVDLSIYERDFLGVVGPNGGGKTTLVKAILGLVTYSGRISYSEQLLKNGRPAIGYLPQQERFDAAFPISAGELVLSGLQSEKRLTERYTAADKRRATALMRQCGIDNVAKKAVGQISGGELQRALLCRAMIGEPKLLILDEPANFVDTQFETQLYTILRQANERMAVVMVSHDRAAVESLTKRIVRVDRHVAVIEKEGERA